MATIQDMIKHHKNQGMHFFDKATMDFFNSKIESELIDDKFFITSEDNFDRSKTLYTVREYNWETGNITERERFQEFETLEKAREYLNYLTLEVLR